MPEVLDRPSEGIEAKEGRRLIPTGIDRVPTLDGFATVIRGKTEEGEDVAIVLGPDQPQLELILGDNDSKIADSFMAGMMRSKLAKAAGVVLSLGGALTGAAAAGTALINCGGSSDNGGHDGAAFGTHSGALSTNQMMGNIKGQPAPWTDWGDRSTGNFATWGGKNYVFFNWDGSTPNGLFYVECTELIQCFDASAKRQTVEGFQEAQLDGPFKGAKIFKDTTGKDRFQVDPWGDAVNEGDIEINPATGKLKVSNMQTVVPGMTGGSIYWEKDTGVPHAVYGFDKSGSDRNLHTGVEVDLPNTNSGTYEDCGVPTLDGNLAIASKSTTVSGVKSCTLVMGGSLNDVITKATSIVSLNSQIPGPKQRLTDPRLTTLPDGSGILIYTVLEKGPEGEDTRVWYALIPKPVPPPEPDATGDTTDTPDAGTLPDTATVTDTGPGEPEVEVEPDVTTAEDVADAIAEDVETFKDALADIGVDLGDLQEILDAAADAEKTPEEVWLDSDLLEDVPETDPDTPPPLPDVPPDTTPDGEQPPLDVTTPDTTAQDFINSFKVDGNCQLTYAPTTQGGKDGFSIDIDGSATPDDPCVLHGQSKDKQMTITLTNEKDGKIKISCIAFPGQATECEPGLYTKPLVKELGAGTKLKIEGVVMGSEASEFYGMPMGEVIDAHGGTQRFFEVWNAKGEKPVTVNGQNFKFTVDGDGIVYWVNAKTAEKSTTNPFPEFPKPVEGSGIDIGAQKVDAGSAESGGADATSGPDATNPNPPKAGEGGCNTGPDGSPLTGEGALLMAALMLWFRRRKQGARQ